MSRGFVREEDQEELPIVPYRADLPANVPNYVTEVGLNQLLAEKENLNKQREDSQQLNDNEKRIHVNFITAKIQLLSERIMSAKVIALEDQPKKEVRFGATVTVAISDEKKPQTYQIVGVDEANVSKGKIAFTAPIAKMLIDKQVGEEAVLKLADRSRIFKIINISYSTQVDK